MGKHSAPGGCPIAIVEMAAVVTVVTMLTRLLLKAGSDKS